MGTGRIYVELVVFGIVLNVEYYQDTGPDTGLKVHKPFKSRTRRCEINSIASWSFKDGYLEFNYHKYPKKHS